MRHWIRPIIYTIAFLGLIAAIFFAGKPQPTLGQVEPQQERKEFKTPCGCFVCGELGNELRRQGKNPPFISVMFDEGRPCQSIIAENACPTQALSKLPKEKVEKFCRTIRDGFKFNSFRDSCPLLASPCEEAMKCEDSKACNAIGQALEAVKRARTSVGAASIRFNTLKSELNPILNEIDGLICLDNQGARYIIETIRNTMNGKEPATMDIAKNFESIERSLTRLQGGLCTSGPTSPGSFGCKPPEDGGKRYEDLARGERIPRQDFSASSIHPDSHRSEEFFPQPDIGATAFMPLEPCPGCLWQLLAIMSRNAGSKNKPVWLYRTVWHCPSSRTTVVNVN